MQKIEINKKYSLDWLTSNLIECMEKVDLCEIKNLRKVHKKFIFIFWSIFVAIGVITVHIKNVLLRWTISSIVHEIVLKMHLPIVRAKNGQGWEFTHSLITHSLIAHSLIFFKSIERLWANRSGYSRQMSDCEWIAQVVHDKWATWAICSGRSW